MENTPTSSHSRLYRSETDRIIAGIAGGLAEYFKVDSVLFRAAFVLLFFLDGFGFFLYLILWLLVPTRSTTTQEGKTLLKENAEEIKGKAEAWAKKVEKEWPDVANRQRPIWGAILVIIGLFFLLANFGFLAFWVIGKLWPLILIAIGLAILIRR